MLGDFPVQLATGITSKNRARRTCWQRSSRGCRCRGMRAFTSCTKTARATDRRAGGRLRTEAVEAECAKPADAVCIAVVRYCRRRRRSVANTMLQVQRTRTSKGRYTLPVYTGVRAVYTARIYRRRLNTRIYGPCWLPVLSQVSLQSKKYQI